MTVSLCGSDWRLSYSGGFVQSNVPFVTEAGSMTILPPFNNRLGFIPVNHGAPNILFFLFLKFRIKPFGTLRAYAVAKISFRTIFYICFNLIPIPLIVSNHLA